MNFLQLKPEAKKKAIVDYQKRDDKLDFDEVYDILAIDLLGKLNFDAYGELIDEVLEWRQK